MSDQDARFEDGRETPLNLGALEAEDLEVISTLVQDAVFPMTEMTWRSNARQFALLLNRFRWEDSASKHHTPERVQSVLLFENVLGVASHGIDRADKDVVLSLLSIAFEPGEDGAGIVVLTLAGDGALRLKVEALEARLKDVTRPLYRAIWASARASFLMVWDYRILTPADQPQWRALRLDALETFPAAFLTTAEEQRTRAASEDRKFLASGNWRGLFDEADELIGMAALIPSSAAAARHRMQLGAVYVSQPHWGSGAAQKLLDDIEAEARRKNALQLELSVSSENPRAIRFYERNGYERMGIEPRAIIVDGRGIDDFSYVKFLDQ